MSTKDQMDFFRELFDREQTRGNKNQELAELYIKFTPTYAAFIIFITEKIKPDITPLKILISASIASSALSFLLALAAAGISKYENVTDPNAIHQKKPKTPPADSDFFDARIADYSVSTTRNKKVNDRKAIFLQFSGYLTILGISCFSTFFIIWTMS